MTIGHIYTVASTGNEGSGGNGGPATQAFFRNPLAVTVDHAGNVLISDTDNNSVRVVAVKTGTFYGRAMIAGDIYTVAGNGTMGYFGDGGPATQAELFNPAGVALNKTGGFVIADTGNHRIRAVSG